MTNEDKIKCEKLLSRTRDFFEQHDVFYPEIGKFGYIELNMVDGKGETDDQIGSSSAALRTYDELNERIMSFYIDLRVIDYIESHSAELLKDDIMRIENGGLSALPKVDQDSINADIADILKDIE